jgi:hypothetical protein
MSSLCGFSSISSSSPLRTDSVPNIKGESFFLTKDKVGDFEAADEDAFCSPSDFSTFNFTLLMESMVNYRLLSIWFVWASFPTVSSTDFSEIMW